MLKIMIVDDEENIRIGIAEGIHWADYDLEVACTAANGQDALFLAELNNPDIILADINMPIINGLEFSHRVKEFLPDVEIIILTGYSEFDYAKESIRIGVRNYLLKPVSPTELISAVIEARERIHVKSNKEAFIKNLQLQIKRAMPVLTEKLVYDVLHGNFSSIEINDRLGYLNIVLPSDKLVAFVIEIDNYTDLIKCKGEDEKNLMSFAVKNISDKILSDENWGLCIISSGGLLECMICLKSMENHKLKETLLSCAESIRSSVHIHLGFTISIGVGSIYSGLNQVNLSYREAEISLKYKSLIGSDGIYDIAYLDLSSPYLVHYPFEKEVEMFNALKAGNDSCMKALEQIFQKIESFDDAMAVGEYAKTVYRQILSTALRLIPESVQGFTDVKINYDYLLGELCKENTTLNFRNEITGFIKESLHCIIKSKGLSYRNEIEMVKKYIDSNFIKDLSLKDISGRVFMNPNYLCNVFKSEVGETINSYIIKIRMENAKDLLTNSCMKVFEIAEAVGYNNTNYFSYAFKKYSGVSPNDFKNIKL